MIIFSNIEKYAIVSILSQIMKADGIIHPKEEEYMNRIYSELGITINNIGDISNIDDIQAKQIISGMTDESKAQARTLFVGMAEADGIIHPKETEIINQLFV